MARIDSRPLDAGGLNLDRLPMKLFAGGNAKFWNPADIDFSRDRADWEFLDRPLARLGRADLQPSAKCATELCAATKCSLRTSAPAERTSHADPKHD